jgi:phosphocarrier protein HPr
MPERTVIINHKVGLHARPAAMFVQTAAKFASDIQVTHGTTTANAKSILSILTLGVHQGSEITIKAEGQDAEAVLDALVSLVESNFGETQ